MLDWLSALPGAAVASATLALQPPVLPVSIQQPVFVLGHWRSGTTWLHELLSLNSNFCTPNVYECLYPYHFSLTEASLGRSGHLRRPQPRPMDGMPVTLDSPQEDEFALLSLGAVSMYRWMILPTRFEACLEDLDAGNWSPEARAQWTAVFQSFLGRVQAQRPGRLLLKSPTHQFRVPLLRALYPSARFIHLTRDPRSVYTSSVKLWQDMFKLHAREPVDGLDVGECVIRIGEVQERVALPAISELPPDVCCRIHYEHLIAKPFDTLETIYRQLDLSWTDDDISRVGHYLQSRQNHRAASSLKSLRPDLESELRRRWPLAFSLSATGGSQ